MIRFKVFIASLIVLASMAFIAVSFASAGALDGKTFEITLTREDGNNEGPDTLIFAEGTFDSTMCRQYGFKKTGYTTKAADGAVTFEAAATSPKEGKNQWSGTVRGNKIEGTLKWVKEGKTTSYKFEGKLAS